MFLFSYVHKRGREYTWQDIVISEWKITWTRMPGVMRNIISELRIR